MSGKISLQFFHSLIHSIQFIFDRYYEKQYLLDGLRSVARVGETAVIAARAGIKYATEKPSNAKLMRETFESLGSTYIKLGQFIASTPSLFPREYVEEFQGCLDQTPSLPFSYVQGVLASEFEGRNLSEILHRLMKRR